MDLTGCARVIAYRLTVTRSHTIERVLWTRDAVIPSHCALGIMVNSSAADCEWQERGVRYITTTFESLVAPAMRSYLRGAREG